MSSKFKLTKEGLKRREWDGEARCLCKLHKENGKYVYRDKKTKEIVASGDTEDEASEFFWKPKEINHPYVHLREVVEIEEGYTYQDFFNFVRNGDLHGLAEYMFGEDYTDIDFHGKNVAITVRRVGFIKEGLLTIRHISVIGGEKKDCLNVDNNFVLHNLDDGKRFEGDMPMSLLDIMICLWGFNSEHDEANHQGPAGEHERPTVYFRPEGLTLATGEAIDDPFEYLLNPVEVLEGTTLLDVFEYVDADEGFASFLACYSWCRAIKEFHKEARLPVPEKEEEDEYSGGLIHTYVNRDLYLTQYKNEKPNWVEGMDFYGLGHASKSTREHYESKGETPPETERYGIGFSGCQSYSRLPVVLDDKLEVYMDGRVVKGKLVPREVYATCKTTVTLLEFLDAIYWEISFYGVPEARDEQWSCLKERVDSIKEGLDEGKPVEELGCQEIQIEEASEEGNVIAGGKRYNSVNEMMRDMVAEDYDEEVLNENFPLEDEE